MRGSPLLLAWGVALLCVVGVRGDSNGNMTYMFEWDCAHSSYPGFDGTCNMITWRSARVSRQLLRDGIPVFGSPEILSFSQVNDLVNDVLNNPEMYNMYLPFGASPESSCAYDRKRVACGYFFRRCRHGDYDMTAHDMCRSVCNEDRESCFAGENTTFSRIPLCDNVFEPPYPWDCADNDVIRENAECHEEQPQSDCVLVPHEGYFLLDIEYGPFEDIPAIFLVFTIVWSCIIIGWTLYLILLWTKDRYNVVQRMIIIVPCTEFLFALVNYFFWDTCVDWGECSYWLNVARANCKLIAETVVFFALLLLGKGWATSRVSLSQFELRRTVLLVCLFYLADSLLMVLQEYVRWFYWVLISLLYLFMVWYISGSMKRTIRTYASALVQIDRDSENFRVIMTKFRFTLNLRLVIFVYAVCVIITHGCRHSLRNVPWWPQIIAQQILQLSLVTVLLFLLRYRNENDLFSLIGTGDVFDADDFKRLPPILVANVDSGSTSLGNRDEKSEGDMLTTSPLVSNRKRSIKKRWLGRGRSSSEANYAQRRLAPVLVVRNPSGKRDAACIGVSARFVGRYEKSIKGAGEGEEN